MELQALSPSGHQRSTVVKPVQLCKQLIYNDKKLPRSSRTHHRPCAHSHCPLYHQAAVSQHWSPLTRLLPLAHSLTLSPSSHEVGVGIRNESGTHTSTSARTSSRYVALCRIASALDNLPLSCRLRPLPLSFRPSDKWSLCQILWKFLPGGLAHQAATENARCVRSTSDRCHSGMVRPTTLAKIKNFPDQVRSGHVAAAGKGAPCCIHWEAAICLTASRKARMSGQRMQTGHCSVAWRPLAGHAGGVGGCRSPLPRTGQADCRRWRCRQPHGRQRVPQPIPSVIRAGPFCDPPQWSSFNHLPPGSPESGRRPSPRVRRIGPSPTRWRHGSAREQRPGRWPSSPRPEAPAALRPSDSTRPSGAQTPPPRLHTYPAPGWPAR